MIHIPCTRSASTSLTVVQSLTNSGEVWVALSEGDSLVDQARVPADALRAALDEVAPAGSYTRTDEGAHIGPEGETDWHGLYLSENRRAEKAEQALTEIAQGGSLTPDDITDEMVKRLRDEERELGLAAVSSEEVARALLTAALTEPTRPEGAEEIESQIEAWSMSPDGGALNASQHRTLADHLAARLHEVGLTPTNPEKEE